VKGVSCLLCAAEISVYVVKGGGEIGDARAATEEGKIKIERLRLEEPHVGMASDDNDRLKGRLD